MFDQCEMMALSCLSKSLTYISVWQSTRAPVEDLISDLQLYRVSSPFDRRCTALEWHPKYRNRVAVGSKGGDIILWDIETTNNDVFIHGVSHRSSAGRFFYDAKPKPVSRKF